MAKQSSSTTQAKPISRRWLNRFKLIPGYDPVATADDGMWFDEQTADNVLEYFELVLKHVEGSLAGQPFKLAEWQAAHVGCALGWKRADGLRRYREVFDFEPRKNGKSSKLAGLCLYMLTQDGEPGAQIYSAAAEKEQASLVFRIAKGMILQEPLLEQRVKIYHTFKSMEYGSSIYKALSSDADTKHGFNSHFVIIDELHAHKNRDLVDVLMTSTGSRSQPMVWHITTSDYNRPSICNEKYEYACKVRDGVIQDSSFLPVIYEATIDDDWTKLKTWKKANPNLGVSVGEEYLKRECMRAQETPTFENTFKRLHLNIRTEQDQRWLQLDKWDACKGEIDDKVLQGEECYAGLDLATTTDITALVLAFDIYGSVVTRPYFWVPEAAAKKRERKDRVPYQTWARKGLIELTPGDVVDYGYIVKRIIELSKQYSIKEIAFDPWNATQTAIELKEQHGFEMIEFRQGYVSMNEPTKQLEKLVISKKLKHGGNEVLRWMASNVSVKTDPAGNIKPDKQKSTEKIDGIVAAIMAIGRMMFHENQKPSVYETRGVRTL